MTLEFVELEQTFEEAWDAAFEAEFAAGGFQESQEAYQRFDRAGLEAVIAHLSVFLDRQGKSMAAAELRIILATSQSEKAAGVTGPDPVGGGLSPASGQAPAADYFNFEVHLAHQAAWSEKTFGPGDRSQGIMDHIVKELCEVLRAKSESERQAEWIDVVILALDGAWRSGMSPQQIISGIVAKQAKNEARVWPDWRSADPNKAIEHVKSADTGELCRWYIEDRGYTPSCDRNSTRGFGHGEKNCPSCEKPIAYVQRSETCTCQIEMATFRDPGTTCAHCEKVIA